MYLLLVLTVYTKNIYLQFKFELYTIKYIYSWF